MTMKIIVNCINNKGIPARFDHPTDPSPLDLTKTF